MDASDVGAGAVLQQEGDQDHDESGQDGRVLHPVAYMSHKFKAHQKAYSTIEKELLALILALENGMCTWNAPLQLLCTATTVHSSSWTVWGIRILGWRDGHYFYRNMTYKYCISKDVIMLKQMFFLEYLRE